ncbi:hypothetical protein NHX12_024810 [Muraenolepis orangiensis]|uniref:Uncharacterized protein n=1 Tax=Muraenolepis orangiensis TaxID=630683 RepID=A0A9Q0EI67_9TELE|nr:hypothetical protein NHX12_024810 [Muraenolepis orangiensis]
MASMELRRSLKWSPECVVDPVDPVSPSVTEEPAGWLPDCLLLQVCNRSPVDMEVSSWSCGSTYDDHREDTMSPSSPMQILAFWWTTTLYNSQIVVLPEA